MPQKEGGTFMNLEKLFHLKENHTDVKTEIMAGITTFMTMAYILAVNPNILSAAGMDRGAVFNATALSSFIATCLMALLSNYPFVLAHGGTILLSAYLDSKMIFLIVMGVLFAGVLQKIYEKVRVHSAGKIPANGMVTVPRMIACMVIFWLSVAALVNNSYNPFIYFRF